MFEVIPVRKSHKRSHYVFCPDSTLPEVKSWRGSCDAPSLFSERGWTRHCSDDMTTGRAGKAVGDIHGASTLREGPSRQNERCEEARLQEAHRVHNAPEDTYERRRGHMEHARRMRPVAPVL